jgi:hypothetical protein
MHTPFGALTAAGLVLAVCTTASAQEQSMANAGTLTCTTSAVPAKEARDIELSCNFQANSGRSTDYVGYVTRAGAADFPEGKRVIVWTVLSRDAEMQTIDGTYRGETGGKPTTPLVGKEGSILLQPVTTTSQIGAEPAPTVLSLRLVATKA